MKYCAFCGKEMMDVAVVCTGCGCATNAMPTGGAKRYCTYCGKEVPPMAAVCMNCGCPTDVPASPSVGGYAPSPQQLVQTLSERVKIDGIIWLVIGCLQLIWGIASFSGEGYYGISLLIIGVINFVSAIKDLKYSQEVMVSPKGSEIIQRFKPMGGLIASLVYNLLFGGIIGVVGNIYYALAVRGYVMNNEAAFSQIV